MCDNRLTRAFFSLVGILLLCGLMLWSFPALRHGHSWVPWTARPSAVVYAQEREPTAETNTTLFLPLITNDAGQRAGITPSDKPEKAFAQAVQALSALLASWAEMMAAGAEPSALQADLATAKAHLLALDTAVRANFAAREEQLVAAALPALILQRHGAAVRAHEEAWQQLHNALAALESAQTGSQWQEAIRHTQAFLQQSQPTPVAHLPNEDDLATRQAQNNPIPISFNELPTVGAAATQAGLSVPGNPPAATDLLPTIDLPLNQELIDLAATLHNSPLQIYQYVKNSIRYEPYLGSRKGALETLQLQAGNDYDQASLLIALLRAAGVPARYVAGRALLPAAQVNSWLGVDSINAAAGLLSMAGLQVQGYTMPSGQALEFDHVWVAAYLPYTNYRGAPEDASGAQWIPLDPSLKTLDVRPGVDIPAAMNFNAAAFVDSYRSTFQTMSPVELYLQQIEAYAATNYPSLTFPADIIRQRIIQPDPLPHLPASLPYLITSQSADYAEIPANKRYRIGFELRDENNVALFTYTADLPAIAGKRTTLSYEPATAADQALIDFYGNLYATPPNLLQIKPVLKIDGVAVAQGGAVAPGAYHTSKRFFYPPAGDNLGAGSTNHPITAGEYQGIAFDPYRTHLGALTPTNSGSLPDTDGLLGEQLYRTAVAYLDRQGQGWALTADTMQVVYATSVAQAIVTNGVVVYYWGGLPLLWEASGLTIDAQNKAVGGAYSVANGTSERIPFQILVGADGSILENRIFEDLYDQEAISTIKVLALAADAGIPICEMTAGNVGACSTMNQSALLIATMNVALTLGYEVVAPRDALTHHDWTGGGFIARNPVTKEGYWYIVEGGLNGGATVDNLDSWSSPWWLVFDNIFRELCAVAPITADITGPAADSYWPVQKELPTWSFSDLWNTYNPPLVFDVDYTICYEGGTSTTVHRAYFPTYPYPAGDQIFRAGWGTDATLNFTMYEVIIETPNGSFAPQTGDDFELIAKVTPRVPVDGSLTWNSANGGIFSQPNMTTTTFSGAVAGVTDISVSVSNPNGQVQDERKIAVFAVDIVTGTQYVNKGYTVPVVAPSTPVTVHYEIAQVGFSLVYRDISVKVKQGASNVLTMTLPITTQSGIWTWDGRDSGGNYVDAGQYQIEVDVTAPNNLVARSAHAVHVVEVQSVEFFDINGNPLDDNAHPTHPGGKRVFPGSLTAGAPRNNVVKVRATLNTNVPANALPIYFESYDVLDPTGLLDSNTTFTDSVITIFPDGSIVDGISDGDDTVEVDFQITMQPGDNFKVLASTNALLSQAIDTTIITTTMDITGTTTDPVLQPLVSERLTVWRRLHIEVDSMEPVAGNQITGTIISVVNNGVTSTVTTDQSFFEFFSPVTETHRFNGGFLTDSIGSQFNVITNTHGSTLTVEVANLAGGIAPIAGDFTLVDDDDFNSDDAGNLDGDIGEDINDPDLSMVMDSDVITDNIFAQVYIRPTYDLVGADVPFIINTLPNNLFTHIFRFDNDATKDSVDFWTIYLVGAYQYSTDRDGDPNGTRRTYGVADADRTGAALFKATNSETATPTCQEPIIVAHEIGHLFGISGNPHPSHGDLMEANCNAIGVLLDPDTQIIIRNQQAP